jgi:hypothetical protein
MDERSYLIAADGFEIDQGGGELVEGLHVRGQQLPRAGFGPGQQGGHFTIDEPLGLLGVAVRGSGARERPHGRPAVADWADRLAEAELADHLGGQGGCRGQVVGGAGGCLSANQEFGGAAAQPYGQGVGQELFPVEPPVIGRELFGQAKGSSGAEHSDPADRVSMGGQGRN